MAISSPGIGSGLDVNSIVTQLLALEKRPLLALQAEAKTITSRISTVGRLQSQMAALQTAASTLASATGWENRKPSISDASAINVISQSNAALGSYAIEVTQLAKAASATTGKVTSGSAIGGGSITITTSNGASSPILIADGSSLSDIAKAINQTPTAGVSASVIKDGLGFEQLVVKSNSTGDSGFTIEISDNDGVDDDAAGLSMLAYNPSGTSVMSTLQQGQNAHFKIDGISITSQSNKVENPIDGITLELKQVTTTPVTVEITQDTEAVRNNIDAFIKAYNELNSTLKSVLRYDEATKTSGVLQGDSIIVGIQSSLRGILGSSSPGGKYSYFSDIGIEMEKGGNLSLKKEKFDAALTNPSDLKNLFSQTTGNSLTEGIALKIRKFSDQLLSFDGTLTRKTESLRNAEKRNTSSQDKINDKLVLVEARLRSQYAALDTKLGSMQALGSYVAQQVAQWSKG